MNKLIAFLEACGADAELAAGDIAVLLATGRAAGLTADELTAISRLDRSQLVGLMAARGNMVCAVFPARDPEPGQDDDGKEDAPEEPKQPSENRRAA
jgi:hypothetical protein